MAWSELTHEALKNAPLEYFLDTIVPRSKKDSPKESPVLFGHFVDEKLSTSNVTTSDRLDSWSHGSRFAQFDGGNVNEVFLVISTTTMSKPIRLLRVVLCQLLLLLALIYTRRPFTGLFDCDVISI